MYNYGGPIIAMEGYVWLWRATYSCGGPCIYITFYIFFYLVSYTSYIDIAVDRHV